MRKFLSILLVFISANLFAQDSLNRIENGARIGHWKITGAMLNDANYVPNETVEEGDYNEFGKKTGLWTSFYPGGIVKARVNYFNNRPHGWMELYYPSGLMQEQGKWVNGRWTGPYSRYYENGKPWQSFNYNEQGQRDGRQVYYYESGTKMIIVYMIKGKEDGVKQEFNCRGELARETSWYMGNVIPEKTKSYTSLSCDESPPAPPELPDTLHRDPRPDPPKPDCNGGYYRLYKNQLLTMDGFFKNCKLIDGKEYIYDENGILLQIKVYKNGKYVGDAVLPE